MLVRNNMSCAWDNMPYARYKIFHKKACPKYTTVKLSFVNLNTFKWTRLGEAILSNISVTFIPETNYRRNWRRMGIQSSLTSWPPQNATLWPLSSKPGWISSMMVTPLYRREPRWSSPTGWGILSRAGKCDWRPKQFSKLFGAPINYYRVLMGSPSPNHRKMVQLHSIFKKDFH